MKNPHSEYQLRNLIVIVIIAVIVISVCWFMQSPFDPLN